MTSHVTAVTLASSSTVLANLAYLIGAVVVAFIGGLFVWIRHRQPKSVDANMASFRRGLSALAPDPRAVRPDSSQLRARPAPTALTHVRIDPASGQGARTAVSPAPAEDGENGNAGDYDQSDVAETSDDTSGGQSG